MSIFGLGTAASMSNLERYTRFTSSMHAVYSSMERNLDESPSPAVKAVWSSFGNDLRRAPSLQIDLDEACELTGALSPPALSPATLDYVAAVDLAGQSDAADDGARVLGHLYCRYFADLFGGQALAGPYRWALALGPTSPRHYDFGAFGANRRESIEGIYAALNVAGETLSNDESRQHVVDEARIAFKHNVYVYQEEGKLLSDGARGMLNMAVGFGKSRMAA